MNKSRLSPAVAVLSGILLTVILIACQGEPATPRVPTTTPTPTAAQKLAPMPKLTPASTATRAPAPTATATPDPTATPTRTATLVPAPEKFAFTVTTATIWGEAFANFTSPQQDCVRDALGQSELNSFLRKTIMTSEIDDYSNLTVPLFSCLDSERAGSLYAGILALHFEEGMGLDLGDSEVTCLRAWATGKDVPRLLANEEADVRLLDEISICIAGPLEPLIVAQIEQSVGRLSSEQEECLAEVMQRYRHLLFRAYVGAGAPEGEAQRMTEELAGCVPELLGNQEEDTSEETVRVITPEPRDFLRGPQDRAVPHRQPALHRPLGRRRPTLARPRRCRRIHPGPVDAAPGRDHSAQSGNRNTPRVGARKALQLPRARGPDRQHRGGRDRGLALQRRRQLHQMAALNVHRPWHVAFDANTGSTHARSYRNGPLLKTSTPQI